MGGRQTVAKTLHFLQQNKPIKSKKAKKHNISWLFLLVLQRGLEPRFLSAIHRINTALFHAVSNLLAIAPKLARSEFAFPIHSKNLHLIKFIQKLQESFCRFHWQQAYTRRLLDAVYRRSNTPSDLTGFPLAESHGTYQRFPSHNAKRYL